MAGKAAKKGKATPAMEEDAIPLPQKPPTTMKKRGEEEEDVKYIGEQLCHAQLAPYIHCYSWHHA